MITADGDCCWSPGVVNMNCSLRIGFRSCLGSLIFQLIANLEVVKKPF